MKEEWSGYPQYLFLGVFYNGKIVEATKLHAVGDYTYPWDVQKGADRLFALVLKDQSLTNVGGSDIMQRMGNTAKIDRNKEIVERRISDPIKWTWGRLGKLYRIDRNTAKDIFTRDHKKYATSEQIKQYKSMPKAQGYHSLRTYNIVVDESIDRDKNIINLFKNKKVPVIPIAKHFGLSRQSVYNILDKYHIR